MRYPRRSRRVTAQLCDEIGRPTRQLAKLAVVELRLRSDRSKAVAAVRERDAKADGGASVCNITARNHPPYLSIAVPSCLSVRERSSQFFYALSHIICRDCFVLSSLP